MRIEFATDQLQRLISTPFFPRDPKEQRELLKACMTAGTEKVLTSSIDDIVRTAESQVTAATIYRAIESNRKLEYWSPSFPIAKPKTDVPDMTAEELDQLPDYVSGLPKNPSRRADALAAWRIAGPKGLNEWRRESLRAKPNPHGANPLRGARERRYEALLEQMGGPVDPIKAKDLKSGASLAKDDYHGDY